MRPVSSLSALPLLLPLCPPNLLNPPPTLKALTSNQELRFKDCLIWHLFLTTSGKPCPHCHPFLPVTVYHSAVSSQVYTHTNIQPPLDVPAIGPYLSPLVFYLRRHAIFLTICVFHSICALQNNNHGWCNQNKPELCVSIKGMTIVLKWNFIMLPALQSFKSPDTSFRTSTEVISFISPLTLKSQHPEWIKLCL